MTTIEVPKDALQKMFDLVIGSMDFGSGFLDQTDHDAIADVAELLGVDCPQSDYFYGFRGGDGRLRMVPRETTYCADAPVLAYATRSDWKPFQEARLRHPGHFIEVVDGKAMICGGASYR